MKFPESWLRELVNVDADRDALAATLTSIGLEVESLDVLGEGLDRVVVAEIIACERHPEADRLQVCRVATGSGEVQIVCGAPNARAGLKAPLAMVGARLPGGIEIRAAKLRGVESQGMLCSARELGIDADASGLMELAEDAPVGASLAQHLVLPDARFELKLTPNRADCFSLRGIAYDVAAALGGSVKALDVPAVAATSARGLPLRLDADDACPRYCGRVIEDVDVRVATPSWMRERLRRAGIRPVSFLVDVTQYVMLELGQPMHAFDLDTLSGGITVRQARAGERVSLLDGRDVSVDEGYLVIADERGAVALAGIMGGLQSRVTDETRNVFLEAAHFAPAAITGRARKLGMHTDASHRFERGVDPELPRLAIERATALILRIASGRPGPTLEAALPQWLRDPAPVVLRRARLARVLGTTVPDAEVERILSALGMHVSETADGWQVTAPTRRFDIAIEEDLIEEVARIHGYDAIPLHAPTGAIQLAATREAQIGEEAMRAQLAARGYVEAVNFAFLDGATLARWNLDAGAVHLANPLSAELGVMRTSLVPGLTEALRRNLDRQGERVRLFELGRVFHRDGDAPKETRRIAAVAAGPAQAEQWGAQERRLDLFDIKGDLESLLALRGTLADVEFRPASVAWLHPGAAAEIWCAGARAGVLGRLHPALCKTLDIPGDVFAFEVDLDVIEARGVPSAGPVSRFPSVRRDLAVVVAESTPWSALEASLRGALGPVLRELRVFDRYTGPGLEAGFKSLAIGLILQDACRTLTDTDADQAVHAALAALDRDCSAKLRG